MSGITLAELQKITESSCELERVDSCVVRLSTTMWVDKRGLSIKKSLIFLRKKCTGFNVLEEDVGNIGAEEVLLRILNLYECKDGIYEVVTCNESRDFETGYIDDYDYKLVAIKEENDKEVIK
jgi:hypothetical protein